MANRDTPGLVRGLAPALTSGKPHAFSGILHGEMSIGLNSCLRLCPVFRALCSQLFLAGTQVDRQGTVGEEGPREQLGWGQIAGGHRGSTHPGEDSLSLGGTGSWTTASGARQACKQGTAEGVSGPSPYLILCAQGAHRAKGVWPPLRLPSHPPKTISSVRLEDPLKEKL